MHLQLSDVLRVCFVRKELRVLYDVHLGKYDVHYFAVDFGNIELIYIYACLSHSHTKIKQTNK